MRGIPVRHLAIVALLSVVQARTALAQQSAESDDDAATSGAPAVVNQAFEPPVLLTRVQSTYPTDGDGHRVEVELLITIDVNGAVATVDALGHIPTFAPTSFDAVAIEAARTMRFRAARRSGQPVAVRVRYHMAIVPPLVVIAPEPRASSGPPEVAEIDDDDEPVAPRRAPVIPADSVVVRGLEHRNRTASEYLLPIGLLARVPRTNGPELLTLVPGAFLSNENTEGDAHEVFLRGFGGDNGQDIAFTLEGVPLNDESNPRSQGYADLYFIIPELVDRLGVTEGLADPREGNFALAGAIDYQLGLHQRGLTVRGSYGTYGYGRFVALYGPAHTNDQTFAGIDLVHSDGFGPSRRFDRASGLGQFAADLGGGVSVRVLAGLYATRWDSPGPLRQDDFEAGRVGFFGVSPNAGFQGGFSTRGMLSATVGVHHANERAELQAFATARDLAATENFTGYLEHPDTGDLRSSRYSGAMFGARGYYHRTFMGAGRAHEAEIGWFLRHDRFNVVEQALDARTMAPLATPDSDDSNQDVRVTNIGVYLDAAIRPFGWLTLRGAARFDVLAYDVDGLAFNPMDLQFERSARTAIGSHLGPKATVEFDLGRGFAALASFGSGFRSPDARVVPNAGPIPVARATSEEIGLRYVLPVTAGRSARASASLTVFHTAVDNDSIFDPTRGDLAPIGPTTRYGGVLWVRTQPLAWLDLNASLAYTHATTDGSGLDGLLHPGDSLPYLPWLVGRIDMAAEHQIATLRTLPVHLRGGIGAGLRGPRPLLLNASSPSVFLLDASAGVRVGPVAVDLTGRNLLDVRWRESEFEYASNFTPGTVASPTPVRHFTAGAPFTIFATLSLSL